MGILLLSLGWILLMAADSTQAGSEQLSILEGGEAPVCTGCHISLDTPSLDPCDVCHEANQLPESTATFLQNQLRVTRQRVLELEQNPSVQQDSRYQTVIHELEAASRIEKYAAQETTFQRAFVLLEHVDGLLNVLENEIHSGYWVSGGKSETPPNGWLTSTQLRIPQEAARADNLLTHRENIPFVFLNESLNTQARFLLYFTVQRRGPPSEYDALLFWIGKRLPSLHVQSLFYYVREITGRDRSASHISFFLSGRERQCNEKLV